MSVSKAIKHNTSNSLFSGLIIFCFFPYLQLIPLPTDSQPYALLISILILIANGFRFVYKESLYLLIVAIFACLFAVYGGLDFNTVRSVINYVSLFTIATATNIMFVKFRNIPFKLFKQIVYIWGIVAVIQQFIYPTFCSFLISRMAEVKYGRGVCSLAPEPTFYAIICALLSIICYLNYHENEHYKKLQLIIWLQLIILSRSTTMIMLALLSYVVYKGYIIVTRRPILIFYGLSVVLLIYFIIPFLLPYIEQYRFGILFSKLLENPQLFVTVDESVNERFIHAFFPLYGFIVNYGMPHFYGNFSDFMNGITSSGQFQDYIPYVKDNYTRIMSGLGSALFELGLPALLIVIVLINCIKMLIRNDQHFLFYGILLVFILMNAMPLSNALVGFVFGNLIYCKHNTPVSARKH